MTEIVKINPSDYGLTENKAKEIENAFSPMLKVMTELEIEFNGVISKEISAETVKEARTLRLKYVKIRTATAQIHKEMKDFYLSGGRAVDGWKNAQIHASQGNEERLSLIENYYENLEQERLEKVKQERIEKLLPFQIDSSNVDLKNMAEDVFQNYLNGVRLSFEQKKEAERLAEEERLAKIKAEEEERKRIIEENEKLKLEKEKLEAEGLVREKAEQDRLEQERLAREKVEQEHQRQLESERLAREKAEQEKAKIEQERLEKEQKETLEKEELLKREKDEDNKKAIETSIVLFLIEEGIDEKIARKVFKMISSGMIKNLKIQY